jgi:hypothetical protein
MHPPKASDKAKNGSDNPLDKTQSFEGVSVIYWEFSAVLPLVGAWNGTKHRDLIRPLQTVDNLWFIFGNLQKMPN